MKLAEWLERRAGLTAKKLEVALSVCDSNMVETVGELRVLALDENEKRFEKTFPQSMLQTAILMALKEDPKDEPDDDEKVSAEIEVAAEEPKNRNDGAQAVPTDDAFPPGKRYAYFASHKKQHTRFGDSSADLARAQKDYMLVKYNLEGYFDADNLQKINKESITRGIVESCSVLLYLNDETLTESEWCRHEVDEARRYGIPIIVLVDTDKQLAREVIDKYMELGFSWLFDEQVIEYSTQARETAYLLCSKAIRRAIQYCALNDTLTPKNAPEGGVGPGAGAKAGADKSEGDRAHNDEAGNDTKVATDEAGGALGALKTSLLSVYGSAQAAFEALSSDGFVGRKQWKRAMKKASLDDYTGKELKELRSSLPKLASSAFCSFVDGSAVAEESSQTAEASHLAPLPPEVPALPSSFRHREHAEAQLTSALLESGHRSTSLTAPKSRVSSQGMGGVGKTMLTAAVVRSDAIRSHFRVICWLNCSQEPQLMQLQQNLHEQLTDNKSMPQSATKNAASQLRELIKSAKGKLVLLVLDDMWSREHAEPFDCVDATNDSKLLVTTRIKGILDKGTEVELELLSVRESVELLSAEAQLDTSEVSPCMIEISQLCGRLPLCLNIVGNLIRTWRGEGGGGGVGWEEEIPSILKSDMKSLSSGKGLNLQQRVIQSGLDSLEVEDAEDIVLLFKGMAVFAEDQVVPVAILSVLWVSINPKEHKPLSGMKVRQWVSQLLSRSILLGSVSAGISMHDIVRDFTRGSSSPSELQQRQHGFVQALVSATEGNSVASSLTEYCQKQLSFHIKGAIVYPLAEDVAGVQQWIVHDNDGIAHQTITSAKLAQVYKLAAWFRDDKKDLWSSARLFRLLSLYVDPEQRSQNMKSAVAVLAQVNAHSPANPKAIGYEIQLRKYLAINKGKQEEADIQVEFFLRLVEDKKRMAGLNKYHINQMNIVFSCTYLGYCSSRFAFSVSSISQLLKGACINVENCALAMSLCKDWDRRSFKYVAYYGATCTPWTSYTLTWVDSKAMNDKCVRVLGDQGERLLDFVSHYDFGEYHERAATRNVCYVHAGGPAVAVLLLYAAVPMFERLVGDWLGFDRKAQQLGASFFDWTSVNIWPGLTPAILAQSMRFWSVSWESAESRIQTLPPNKYAYTRQECEKVFKCFEHEGLLLNVQMTILTRLPEAVQAADAHAALPQIDHVGFADHICELYAYMKPPLLLAAQAAQHLDKCGMAEQYAQKALIRHRNPVKIYWAHCDLGSRQPLHNPDSDSD